MNKRRVISVIFGILTLGMTIFIIANSLKVGEESTDQSDKIVKIAEKILEIFGIDPEYADLSFFIRKLGHFSEYFLLATVSGIFALNSLKNKKLFPVAAIYAFIVAVCDEFIAQANTPGRGPSWRDVFIDMSGVIIALGIIFLIITIKKRRGLKNAQG